MSIASQVSRLQYAVTSLTQAMATFAFNQPGDLLVSDGAITLVLNSDYTVTGGGYNNFNQLLTGTVTLTNTGGNAGSISLGDNITISRNVPLTQNTSFASTGLQTPLMIEQDDDKLTTIAQELEGQIYNPFPPSGGGPQEICLGYITALTGGLPGCIDALGVSNIPNNLLPLFIRVSIADYGYVWKLRPMQMGDPSVTTLPNYIVPVTNPNNLIWVSQ